MGNAGSLLLTCVALYGAAAVGFCGDGNRLTYLEENNPYYPHAGFPKLTTPQWIGEEGVEAVVILAIDDMREPPKYEAFLRPILQRLKQIDGRAPVSIMTCNVQPDDPQLASWLGEGLSLEVHTVDHPCPLLQGGDFAKAKSTYDRCVDLLNKVPGNKPVAFRMPCCDSLNTVSPRFYAEIFGKTTPEGNFLQISSSVFNVFTKDDPEVAAELVTDPDGSEKFRKYLPKNLKRGDAVFNTFVNWIENYPYPYVINRVCWEFPCMVPSDWEAQHLQQPNNPQTVRDMQAALDITVLKQGVFCLVFHPHGWIKSEQVVELIDHAVARHGSRVKFLTFREALGRLNENLLGGQALRDSAGSDKGVRVLDLNADRSMDVLISNERVRQTRIWSSETKSWIKYDSHSLPRLIANPSDVTQPQFGIVRDDGAASLFDLSGARGWTWAGERWEEQLCSGQHPFTDYPAGKIAPWALRPAAAWLRDFPRWDQSYLVLIWVASARDERVQRHATWSHVWDKNGWGEVSAGYFQPAIDFDLTSEHAARAVRFVDLNGDGGLDLIYSDAERYAIHLLSSLDYRGRPVLAGKRGERPPEQELPPIVRADGSDNGFFVHSGHLFWQNEDTDTLPDLVDRRSFAELLKGASQPGNR